MPDRPAHDADRLRLSDAERDEAARLLGEHYAAGRLTVDEHEERTAAAYAAKTRAELLPLFGDLPGAAPGSPVGRRGEPDAGAGVPPGLGSAPPWAGRPRRGGPPRALRLLLAVVLVAFAVTHLPLLLVGLLAWWLIVTVLRRPGRSHGWACAPSAVRPSR